MRKQTGTVDESVSHVKQVSEEVTAGIKEISLGLGEINQIMAHLTELSHGINSIGKDLDQSISVFKTDEKE